MTDDVEVFGLVVLVSALAGLASVLSSRLSERARVPAPVLFLVAAALASNLLPVLGTLSVRSVERVVTVALAVILFDGGMHIGWRRFREAAGATAWLGVAGTFVTAAAVAVLAHFAFGLGWLPALLLGTALAPTDPAVVFSVLGRRQIGGRSGVLLEGESGANDPVGIALLVALLGAGTGGGLLATSGAVAGTFVLQMLVGGVIGVAGGLALVVFMRRVPLPSEGLYPLRVLASALVLYGLAAVCHGSGFLAVFVAGIVVGDARAPYKREIERFHSSLGSLAEVVAFVLLGLSVDLRTLADPGVWAVGLALAALLAFVVRPLLVGAVLLPVRLTRGERAFVLWTGLKGAVPILLGTFVVGAGVPGAERLYGIIFVVVGFSVLVQGSLVPAVAHRVGVPLRTVEPEPWSAGARLQHEPEGLLRTRVGAGSSADGATLAALPVSEGFWVSLIVRDGRLITLSADTLLAAGDDVVALTDPDHLADDHAAFAAPSGL